MLRGLRTCEPERRRFQVFPFFYLLSAHQGSPEVKGDVSVILAWKLSLWLIETASPAFVLIEIGGKPWEGCQVSPY